MNFLKLLISLSFWCSANAMAAMFCQEVDQPHIASHPSWLGRMDIDTCYEEFTLPQSKTKYEKIGNSGGYTCEYQAVNTNPGKPRRNMVCKTNLTIEQLIEQIKQSKLIEAHAPSLSSFLRRAENSLGSGG